MRTSKTPAKQVGFKLGKSDVCGIGWSIGFMIFFMLSPVPGMLCSMDFQCMMNTTIIIISCALAVWITFCGLSLARGKAIEARASRIAENDDEIDHDIDDLEPERYASTTS